jgi:hypothetical protein
VHRLRQQTSDRPWGLPCGSLDAALAIRIAIFRLANRMPGAECWIGENYSLRMNGLAGLPYLSCGRLVWLVQANLPPPTGERRSQMRSFIYASGDLNLENISDLAARRTIKQELLLR